VLNPDLDPFPDTQVLDDKKKLQLKIQHILILISLRKMMNISSGAALKDFQT
jgi:hypothetical protein